MMGIFACVFVSFICLVVVGHIPEFWESRFYENTVVPCFDVCTVSVYLWLRQVLDHQKYRNL
jgi:hypothetical protein